MVGRFRYDEIIMLVLYQSQNNTPFVHSLHIHLHIDKIKKNVIIMADENNNGQCNRIRKETITNKVSFIKNAISREGVPANFKPLPRCNTEKIFYTINAEGKQQREWLFFEENKFFCAYCVCFSPADTNRLVEGVTYQAGCRLPDKLHGHERESKHIAAKNIFTAHVSGKAAEEDRGEKWNALKSIVKIIIFIATHGAFIVIRVGCSAVVRIPQYSIFLYCTK